MQTINEQLLTAYALDELSPEVKAEVEAYLASHPEAAVAVEATRLTAGQLRDELMTELQAAPPVSFERPLRLRPRWTMPLALAASVAVVAGTFAVLIRQETDTRAKTQSNMAQIGRALAMYSNERKAEQTAPPLAVVKGRSAIISGVEKSHDQDGQNTLYADGHSEFAQQPLVGTQKDNIYTVNGAGAGGIGLGVGHGVGAAGPVGIPAPRETAQKPAHASDSVLFLNIKEHDSEAAAPVTPARPGGVFDRNGIDAAHNTEAYDRIVDNAFLDAIGNPLSTFSIDVDTASYSNMRRFITNGQLPPKDAVRIEEMVNYFPYKYEGPNPSDKEKPFAASVEIAGCPWNTEHRLVRVGIKGREMPAEQRPASNLVFLIDVSGSMNEPNKLPLVKQSLRELVNKLDSRDRVAMVVYAGNSGLVLPSTPVGPRSDSKVLPMLKDELTKSQKELAEYKATYSEQHPVVQNAVQRVKKLQDMIDQAQNDEERRSANQLLEVSPGRRAILDAIDHLEAGGSTNGGAGIELAYLTAQSGFIKDGTNRVVLATDGDWNVGITDQGALTRLIEDKATGGTFLTVLGFGMGNTKDSTMEKLADKGNGNYAYIDNLAEARKVLVEQMSGTLVTIAKDVKIQVEFNPAKVASYRLIGYENRLLAKEDFNDDKKDAGEIGAGHTVTALYEVVPPGVNPPTTQPGVDPLKYQHDPKALELLTKRGHSDEMLTLKLRYKAPDAPADVQGTSKLLEFPITDAGKTYAQGSEDFKFAAAVAGFGMILRDSPYKGTATFNSVIELAGEGKGPDVNGYRAEFIQLAQQAKAISGK